MRVQGKRPRAEEVREGKGKGKGKGKVFFRGINLSNVRRCTKD